MWRWLIDRIVPDSVFDWRCRGDDHPVGGLGWVTYWRGEPWTVVYGVMCRLASTSMPDEHTLVVVEDLSWPDLSLPPGGPARGREA